MAIPNSPERSLNVATAMVTAGLVSLSVYWGLNWWSNMANRMLPEAADRPIPEIETSGLLASFTDAQSLMLFSFESPSLRGSICLSTSCTLMNLSSNGRRSVRKVSIASLLILCCCAATSISGSRLVCDELALEGWDQAIVTVRFSTCGTSIVLTLFQVCSPELRNAILRRPGTAAIFATSVAALLEVFASCLYWYICLDQTMFTYQLSYMLDQSLLRSFLRHRCIALLEF